jgi:hypothetical protein
MISSGCGGGSKPPAHTTTKPRTVRGNVTPGNINACLETKGYDVAGIDANHVLPGDDPHALAIMAHMLGAAGVTGGYLAQGGSGLGEMAIWYFDSASQAAVAADAIRSDAWADGLDSTAFIDVNLSYVAYSDPELAGQNLQSCLSQALS